MSDSDTDDDRERREDPEAPAWDEAALFPRYAEPQTAGGSRGYGGDEELTTRGRQADTIAWRREELPPVRRRALPEVVPTEPAAAPATPPPASTSPQETAWVEFRLVDEEGAPVAGERYRIKLPDGTFRTGRVGGDGSVRIDGIVEGSCEVAFPDIDGVDWDTA